MQRRRVCALDELPPGSMRLVEAGRFGVGVYNVAGDLSDPDRKIRTYRVDVSEGEVFVTA